MSDAVGRGNAPGASGASWLKQDRERETAESRKQFNYSKTLIGDRKNLAFLVTLLQQA